MAQRRWDQCPVDVCLNAPPSLGQNKHDYMSANDEGSKALAYDWILRRDGAFATKPLSFGNIWHSVAVCNVRNLAIDIR